MVKRTRYAEWKDSYEHYKFELSPEGILLMQCHTDGGPLQWYWESHDRMADAFALIGPESRCIERLQQYRENGASLPIIVPVAGSEDYASYVRRVIKAFAKLN